MGNDDIKVSIVCNAYNHEAFIKDALEGFVKQKASFKYEVLVHDDASTDNTANIIREYEKKYPEIIKPIYQSENQYSHNPHFSRNIQYTRAKGKYIALCEGDDYWIDPYKLQKQFDALEKNPNIDICTHKGVQVQGDKIIGYVAPADKDCVIPVERVILGGGGFVITNSIMMRTQTILKDNPMMDIIGIDYTVQILGSLCGGMLYLDDCMSAYRVMTPGSWSARMKKDLDKMVIHRQNVIKMLNALDIYTQGKYSDTIDTEKKYIELVDMENRKEYRKMLSQEYRRAFLLRSFKNRMRIRILAVLSCSML